MKRLRKLWNIIVCVKNIRIWKPYWKGMGYVRGPHTNKAYSEYGVSIKILGFVFVFKYLLPYKKTDD